MPRPRTPPGSWGKISISHVGASRYAARARYRDNDGFYQFVTRYGQTKTEAENTLKVALGKIQTGNAHVDRQASIGTLADRWIRDEVKPSRKLAAQTRQRYEYAVERYVKPQIGTLTIGEATTSRCDAALGRVEAAHGAAAARTTRSVLRSMFGMAIRHDALALNPVRETRAISTIAKRGAALALTPEQVEDLTDRMRSDARAVLLDLPDLVDFGLATGCRIGEAMAVRDAVLDLEAGAVEINATAIRIKGTGMVIQERPKTAAGHRVLALPPFAVAMLRRRRDEVRLNPPAVLVLGEDDELRAHAAWVAFPAPLARSVRDPSNTAADLREVLDRLGCESCGGIGWHPALKTAKQNEKRPEAMPLCHDVPPFAWVTSHTFRKTVATRLDEAGFSAREIADQLGHSQPSMTMNVYMGRKVVSARAAAALDR